MKFWSKPKVIEPLLKVYSWAVVWDPLALTTADEGRATDDALESLAKAQGEDIIQLRLGDPGEFPVLDLGYYGSPRRFVVRFQVDDNWEDEKAASCYDSLREAVRGLQDAIVATEGWSHWNIDGKKA